MHEASLAQGLLNMILQSLEEYNREHPEKPAARIKNIICGAGLLAGFEDTTLRDCFEIFAEGTLAEGASLSINAIPLECSCLDCGAKFQLEKRKFICPACGGIKLDFKGGNGLILQALNVDCED